MPSHYYYYIVSEPVGSDAGSTINQCNGPGSESGSALWYILPLNEILCKPGMVLNPVPGFLLFTPIAVMANILFNYLLNALNPGVLYNSINSSGKSGI